jgi:5-methylcytosine-specific restriction protein A
MNFEVISSIDDLIKNIQTLESYRTSQNQEEKKFYSYLFSRGKTFLLIRKEGEIFFGPSKFIGYKDNSMDLYNTYKGHPVRTMTGVETNGAISELLKTIPKENKELEKELIDYYVTKDLKYNSYKKKFWELVI